MLTKEQACALTVGKVLHHTTIKGSDGEPARCRVSGACKTWKREPERFKLPVKHGLFDSFYITNFSAAEWNTAKEPSRPTSSRCVNSSRMGPTSTSDDTSR